MKEKRYVVFHIEREDEYPAIKKLTKKEIVKISKECSIHDFAIIDGTLVKPFFGACDLKKLEEKL